MPPLDLGGWKVSTRTFQYLTRMHHVQQDQSDEHRQCIKVELELLVSKYHIVAICTTTEFDETKDNSHLVKPNQLWGANLLYGILTTMRTRTM